MRRTFYQLFIGIILVLLVSIGCGRSQSLNTENVVLITLDGLRWQEVFSGADSSLIGEDYVEEEQELKELFWSDDAEQRRMKLLPFVWSVVAKQGQLYGNRWKNSSMNCTNQLWFSYPGYNEILTGFPDDDRIISNDKLPNPNITVLEKINRQVDFQGKVAAFGSWDVFPFIINEDRSGVPVNAGMEKSTDEPLTEREVFLNRLIEEVPSPWSTVRLDAFTFHYAMEYIKKRQPRVLYIAFDETDDFAHDGRYDQYLKAANKVDKLIGELWNYLQSDQTYRDKTTLIITTDHGRGTIPQDSWRDHGKAVNGADQIWLAVVGPDTKALGDNLSGQFYQNQIAATVAALLNVTIDNDKMGKPISEIMK